jgi:hypothetical protein
MSCKDEQLARSVVPLILVAPIVGWRTSQSSSSRAIVRCRYTLRHLPSLASGIEQDRKKRDARRERLVPQLEQRQVKLLHERGGAGYEIC